MAYKGWKDFSNLLVGGYDIHTAVDEFSARFTAGKKEFRPAAATWPVNLDTGARTGELTCGGALDSPTMDPVLSLSGTGVVVSALLEGNTAGARFWGFSSALVSDGEVVVSSDMNEITRFVPGLTASGPCSYGYVVAPLAARTTAGNTDSAYVDLGAAQTGGYVFVNATALTLGGYTNVVLTLRHSTDHITFTSKATVATLTAIGGAYYAVSGAVNRYVSLGWAWTGAGSNQSVTAFLGYGV